MRFSSVEENRHVPEKALLRDGVTRDTKGLFRESQLGAGQLELTVVEAEFYFEGVAD